MRQTLELYDYLVRLLFIAFRSFKMPCTFKISTVDFEVRYLSRLFWLPAARLCCLADATRGLA